MSNLKQLVESFVKRNYKKVQRNEKAYRQTNDYISSELERKLDMYLGCIDEDQTARLIRDDMDHLIRRHQDYCIRGNIGSHYIASGIKQGDTVFEHVIPANVIRDMLIQNKLSINQALNSPTCLISKTDDVILRKSGLATSSPDYWHFFDRYSVLNCTFKTYNGQAIADLHSWTLEEHFKFFNVI